MRPVLRWSVALVLSPLLATGCAPEPWPTTADEEAALQVGTAAADALTSSLIGHLTAALDSAGPAGAIDFCATEALPLTRGAAATVGDVDVKRTSARIRNPANAPDSLEAEALAWFEARRQADGVLPSAWVQAEGTEALRYYRALVVNDLCVQCHGPVTALSPEVLEVLDRLYPQDAATGYLPGDLRGLIRVRVPRSSAP
jgi:hypothetical protein